MLAFHLRTASLKTRILAAQGAIFLATLVAFAIAYLAFEQGDARYHIIDDGYSLTKRLGQSIVRQPDGSARFAPGRDLLGDLAEYPESSYAAVDEASGEFVRLPDGKPQPPLNLPNTGISDEGWLRFPDSKGRMSNLVFNHIKTDAGVFRVFYLKPESSTPLIIEGLWDELGDEILPVLLPVMAVGLILTWLTVTRTLRPLDRAAREALTVSQDKPGKRVSTEGLPDELVPLVAAVNTGIGRLEGALEQQRRFSANTAHQLRTPLAILRARIDTLPRTIAKIELTYDADRMTRLVNQLLTASRLDAGQFTEFSDIRIAEFLRPILADFAPLAHDNDRDVELVDVADVTVSASVSVLDEAVRNLIDNALRHTPPGTSVQVSVLPDGTITVRDFGAGVAPEFREQIFEPFWSGAGIHGGAGLGLAIVKEAATLHRGTITVGEADGGGAIFRLWVPTISRAAAIAPISGRQAVFQNRKTIKNPVVQRAG